MSDKYEPIRLRNQLCFPLYLCAKEVTRRYAPFLDELDLTYTQYVVMMYLWEQQKMPQGYRQNSRALRYITERQDLLRSLRWTAI